MSMLHKDKPQQNNTTLMFFAVYETLYKEKNLSFESKCKLQHNNASKHSAHVMQPFLNKHNIPVVSQFHYSPDLARCNFFLLPKTKTALCFQSMDEIEQYDGVVIRHY